MHLAEVVRKHFDVAQHIACKMSNTRSRSCIWRDDELSPYAKNVSNFFSWSFYAQRGVDLRQVGVLISLVAWELGGISARLQMKRRCAMRITQSVIGRV